MKAALITAIEGNGNNLNEQRGVVDIERRFEDEAVKCFEAWRKNGGWLADIEIYAYCPTHNTVSVETQNKFRELGVNYIEKYHPITEEFPSGFCNVPLICSVLEAELDCDVLIKIDLDMNLIKPLPPELVNSEVLICGQYDDLSAVRDRIGGQNPYDTGFTISRRSSGFYRYFFDELMRIIRDPQSDAGWLPVREQFGEYYLEEYLMDRIVAGGYPVQPIQRYQIGEEYTSVKHFTDEELLGVYFWHEHLIIDPTKYDRTRERVLYFNRMAKLK